MKVWLRLASVPTQDLPRWAIAAEALGFEGLSVGEHVLEPPTPDQPTLSVYPYSGAAPWPTRMLRPDPWVAFAACAAVTTRLKFMTDVSIPVHEPVNWAKAIATASVISGGRVALGAGVGWLREEFAATGNDFSRRGRLLDERLELMQRLWAGEGMAVEAGAGPVALPMTPPYPAARVPIMIGGASAPAWRRAARHDGWLGAEVVVEDLSATISILAQERQAIGRDGPFEIVVALKDDPCTRESYEAALAAGATAVTTYAWSFQGATTEARLDALASFARAVGIAD